MLVMTNREVATESYRSNMLEQYYDSQRLLEEEQLTTASVRDQMSQLKSDCNDREWHLLEQIAYLKSLIKLRDQQADKDDTGSG